MSELLSCPFCGGEAETWDGAGPWHVVCTKCGTIGSPCLSEAEAIAAWNTRAERTCRNTSDSNYFRCSVCRKKTYRGEETFNYCPSCGCKVVGE